MLLDPSASMANDWLSIQGHRLEEEEVFEHFSQGEQSRLVKQGMGLQRSLEPTPQPNQSSNQGSGVWQPGGVGVGCNLGSSDLVTKVKRNQKYRPGGGARSQNSVSLARGPSRDPRSWQPSAGTTSRPENSASEEESEKPASIPAFLGIAEDGLKWVQFKGGSQMPASSTFTYLGIEDGDTGEQASQSYIFSNSKSGEELPYYLPGEGGRNTSPMSGKSQVREAKVGVMDGCGTGGLHREGATQRGSQKASQIARYLPQTKIQEGRAPAGGVSGNGKNEQSGGGDL
jgi:hypothetical protein